MGRQQNAQVHLCSGRCTPAKAPNRNKDIEPNELGDPALAIQILQDAKMLPQIRWSSFGHVALMALSLPAAPVLFRLLFAALLQASICRLLCHSVGRAILIVSRCDFCSAR